MNHEQVRVVPRPVLNFDRDHFQLPPPVIPADVEPCLIAPLGPSGSRLGAGHDIAGRGFADAVPGGSIGKPDLHGAIMTDISFRAYVVGRYRATTRADLGDYDAPHVCGQRTGPGGAAGGQAPSRAESRLGLGARRDTPVRSEWVETGVCR